MKRKTANQSVTNGSGRTALKSVCLAVCQKVLERIAGAREMIFNEWRGMLRAQEHLLQLALNEAEAAAWQTAYPDLVFPVLAIEKVQAVVAWDAKLQRVRGARYTLWSAGQAKDRSHLNRAQDYEIDH
jgi:hypothetical protein